MPRKTLEKTNCKTVEELQKCSIKTKEKEGKNMINDVTLGAIHTHTGIFKQISINKENYNFYSKVEVFLSCVRNFIQVFIITKLINEARISVN